MAQHIASKQPDQRHCEKTTITGWLDLPNRNPKALLCHGLSRFQDVNPAVLKKNTSAETMDSPVDIPLSDFCNAVECQTAGDAQFR